MKYKIFFQNTEVAEFETMKECIEFILLLTKVNVELKPRDFSIYGLIN